MTRQKTGIGAVEEPKKERLSKFKNVFKTMKTRMRNRTIPIIVASMLAVSPAIMQNKAYAQEGMVLMAQIEEAHSGIKNNDALMRILYINAANSKKKISESMKKVVENISGIIEENQDNKMFCMTLNSILREVLDTEESEYYVTADKKSVTVKDSLSGSTKMMSIFAYGKDGVEVDIFYLDTNVSLYFKINPSSTSDEVSKLRAEASRYLGVLVSDMILLNSELEENKGKKKD